MKLNEAKKLVDNFDRRDIVKYRQAVAMIVKNDEKLSKAPTVKPNAENPSL